MSIRFPEKAHTGIMSILASTNIVAFVCTRDPAHAKAFYGDTLGLRLVSEDRFAVVFDANGILLRVSIFPDLKPAPFTVLGWSVSDIAAAVTDLEKAGVKFERIPGLPQDELGVWTTPDGSKVAWFKDPDGNTLSISQHE